MIILSEFPGMASEESIEAPEIEMNPIKNIIFILFPKFFVFECDENSM